MWGWFRRLKQWQRALFVEEIAHLVWAGALLANWLTLDDPVSGWAFALLSFGTLVAISATLSRRTTDLFLEEHPEHQKDLRKWPWWHDNYHLGGIAGFLIYRHVLRAGQSLVNRLRI